jgi:capsular exopolysaccharide synthesis family protein
MASQALVPFKKSFPPMVLIGFVALLMGSAAGMALATAREYFVTGFVDADSLEAALGVPVVATIPAGQGATRLQDEIVEAPFSVFSESVRRWKLSIDFLRKRESTCILITSSVKGEGKTTLALALARAYAVAGIDTILVDADLRNPSVGRYIGVKAATGGLGRILTSPNSATTVQEALVKDPISSLRLLLGGGGGDEPGERLVSPEAWMRMILDVRKESSIIIIDSPPILPVIDAAVIARFVDVVSFVVKFASTPEAAAREGVRGISVSGGPEITAVLNGNRRSPDGTPATYTSYDAY